MLQGYSAGDHDIGDENPWSDGDGRYVGGNGRLTHQSVLQNDIASLEREILNEIIGSNERTSIREEKTNLKGHCTPQTTNKLIRGSSI